MKERAARSLVLLIAIVLWAGGPASAGSGCRVKQEDVRLAVLAEVIGSAKEWAAIEGPWDFVGTAGALAAKINGILTRDPTPEERFAELKRDLFAIGSTLFQHDTELEINRGYADMRAALDVAYVVASRNERLAVDSAANTNSDAAVRLGYQTDAFSKRLHDVCANDGGTSWKSAITPPRPDADGSDYDWRFSVPYLMDMIALRLQIIAAVDPEWRRNGSFDVELRSHTAGLDGQLGKMLDGLRCGVRRGDGNVHGCSFLSCNVPPNLLIACADIHTGISVERTWKDGRGVSGGLTGQIRERFRSEVFAELPLFEVQAMVDTLHFYLSHAPDLTELRPRIRVAAAPSLCLQVQSGGAKSGSPVEVDLCNGSGPQQWTYDRVRQEVRNPALTTCLAVRRNLGISQAIPLPGTPVISEGCDGSDYQRWTYDPATQVVTNAFGGVLDIQWANLSPGTPVWNWSRNGGTAQRWSADKVTGPIDPIGPILSP